MVVSLTADILTVAATQGLGFANSITRLNNLNFCSNLGIQSAGFLDAIAPPTVRSSSVSTIRRTLLRKRRRTRRKTYSGGESDDGGDAGEKLGILEVIRSVEAVEVGAVAGGGIFIASEGKIGTSRRGFQLLSSLMASYTR